MPALQNGARGIQEGQAVRHQDFDSLRDEIMINIKQSSLSSLKIAKIDLRNAEWARERDTLRAPWQTSTGTHLEERQREPQIGLFRPVQIPERATISPPWRNFYEWEDAPRMI